MLKDPELGKAEMPICSRCIYDYRVSGIEFDDQGVCNYCHQLDSMKELYGTGSSKGEEELLRLFEEIRKAGKGKPYDCAVGVSGGTDSSYMVYLAKQHGLRPLAVHYDNTWNSAIATQNIRKVLGALDVDLYTHVVDNKEADDIFRSFFYAGVAEIEAATDLGLAETMYRAAAKYSIGYVLEGHSFVTEGITPVGRNYFDGKYIQSIHRKFGRLPMRSYPLMTFSRFLWWAMVARIRKIRPFWYIDYNKEETRTFLEREFGWEYYGGHHLENRMTAFFHGVYAPEKFQTDFRNNTLSAQVRLGKLSREEAWAEYNKPPNVERDLIEYFKKRLGLSDVEYTKFMSEEPKSWSDYPTYKRRFELMRPLFASLAKANLVPMSFYLKYCFPVRKVMPTN
ncbi:N-acetyl sugar amidotransferase [Verrucomicrobia bacterium]|nr:N-acetyl sugar amidotransferase [Verrucomicrobiota bacterium]MDA7657483.1 N-acetyl sugar amidotransferase [Verrucomicrobiota bacterium]